MLSSCVVACLSTCQVNPRAPLTSVPSTVELTNGVLRVAKMCLEADPNDRVPMSRVVQLLFNLWISHAPEDSDLRNVLCVAAAPRAPWSPLHCAVQSLTRHGHVRAPLAPTCHVRMEQRRP